MESLNLLPGEVILIEAVPVKRPATFAHIVLFVVGIMALITSVIVFVSVPEDSYLVGAILLGLAILLLIGGFAAIPKNPVRPVMEFLTPTSVNALPFRWIPFAMSKAVTRRTRSSPIMGKDGFGLPITRGRCSISGRCPTPVKSTIRSRL